MDKLNKKISSILFDLDGTLIDSIPDISMALNNMRRHFNLKPIPLETVRNIVGKGFPTTVRKVLDLSLRPHQANRIFDIAYKITLTEYEKCIGQNTKLFPNVESTLEKLKKYNIKMAVVTNKEEAHAKMTLKHTGLDQYFDLVVGGNTTNNYKPHPDPLLYAMKTLNTLTNEVVIIGDSDSDINAAKAAKIPVIAVTYGYNHGVPIAKSNPDITIDKFDEILQVLTFKN